MVSKCPEWLRTAVFYEVYPQSFYDSNGDGIGDFEGIIQKLDHIAELGCNAIWMNPCFESPFLDAGYDVSNYYKTAPRYGTNADLKRLFRESAKRGIRVCLDLVIGHSSNQHPWFKESCKTKKNKHSNWYIWTDSWLDFENSPETRLVAGSAERDGCYVINFFQAQPALNHGYAKPDPRKPWQLSTNHPDVRALREEIKNIMRYWLDMGASGFRCDMAYYLVKNDPDKKATSLFWREMRTMFDKEYPEAVLIAEWGNPALSIPAGFHMDFLAPHTKADTCLFRYERERNVLFAHMPIEGHSFFERNGKGDITEFLSHYISFYEKTKRLGYISIPSGDHDLSRISLGRNKADLEVVFAFLMTMPGVPMVYYGDEIGMRYNQNLPSKEGGYTRTGSRTPMQWSGKKNAGFSTGPAAKLYLPVDQGKKYPNIAEQTANPKSLLNTVRKLISIRKETPALHNDAHFEVLYAEPKKYPFIYLRFCGKQKIIVAVNPSGTSVSVKFTIKNTAGCTNTLAARGASLTFDKNQYCIEMTGSSYGIYEI